MSKITERHNFKLIISAGFILSSNAGFIASLSLAGLHSATVSHITGDVVRTSIYLSKSFSDPDNLVIMCKWSLVWISFIFGSSISTMIVSGTKSFEIRRTYGWALLLQAFLLWISYLLSGRKTGWWWSEYFAAIACGMQNALCTSYSGAIIRTTHMTGLCTDVGIAIGQEIRIRLILPYREKLRKYLKGNSYDQVVESDAANSQETSVIWRLYVLLPLLFGFLLGAFCGSVTYMRIQNKALLVPAVFTGIVGFIYVISATVYMAYRKVREVVVVEIPMVFKGTSASSEQVQATSSVQ